MRSAIPELEKRRLKLNIQETASLPLLKFHRMLTASVSLQLHSHLGLFVLPLRLFTCDLQLGITGRAGGPAGAGRQELL